MKTKTSPAARRKLVKARHKARIKARRPLHKKMLLHPATIFLLLCIGVLWFGHGLISHASDISYDIHGKVPAPPLTEPAVILSPKDGVHSNTSPVNVTGSCPDNSYVNIERNGVYAGSAMCQAGGTFHLEVGLLAGVNNLQARVYNITDDEGPLSPAITVTYDVPPPPVPTPPSASPGHPIVTVAPFIITSTYQFNRYKIGQEISWQIALSQGTGPYAVNVDWGDKTESNYVAKDASEITISHSYKKSALYSLTINGVDSAGAKAYLQLAVLVGDEKTPAGFIPSSGSTANPIGSSKFKTLVHDLSTVAVYSYGAVLLMVLSYWLGEQHEYQQLTRRKLRHR